MRVREIRTIKKSIVRRYRQGETVAAIAADLKTILKRADLNQYVLYVLRQAGEVVRPLAKRLEKLHNDVLELFNAGQSIKQIAHRLRGSIKSTKPEQYIILILRRHGVSVRLKPWPRPFAERNKAILAQHKQGVSKRELGRRFGVSYQRIQQIVAQAKKEARS